MCQNRVKILAELYNIRHKVCYFMPDICISATKMHFKEWYFHNVSTLWKYTIYNSIGK